jgi:outer membrane protein
MKQSPRLMQATLIISALVLGSVSALQAQVTPAAAPTTAAAASAAQTNAAPPSALAPSALTNAQPQSALAPAVQTNAQPPSASSAMQTNGPAVTTTINTRSISLQAAIEEALAHNFDVQIQRYLPELARFSLEGAYSGWDPVFMASGQHNYSLSPGGLNPYGNQVYNGAETESDNFSMGLSGLTPWGLTYSLTGNASDALGSTPGPLPDERLPFENSTANAAVSQLRQPLLKNFWIDSTRATILINRNRLKYSEFAVRLQMMTTIAQVEQAYYNLIFARENVRVQETALQLAERLLWENKKKVEVGQLAPLDEKQAESQVATSRADLLATQSALDSQENVLKSLITDNYTSLHDVRLIPAENLVAVPVVINLQDSWAKAMELRPDLAQARLDVQRSQITVRLDRNQLLPQLDLVGQYGYSGSGREFSGAIGQISDRANPYWYYGASVSYPIGNIAARNNYKAAKVQKAQSQLVLEQKKQGVLIAVDDAVKLVQTDFARVQATHEARLFAEAALEAEQKKLENGKSTSFFVLQFQRDLTSAKFQEIQALAEYNNALAQLAFQEGTSFERHHLTVQVR